MCISRCGCLATVENGALLRIDPDPEHPTGSAICIKAKSAPELVYHRDRLKTPLLRTRPKGEADPGWQPISWDEALDRIAAKLIGHGPLATAFAVTTPSGTAIADSFGWIHRLAHGFGSPNLVFATENCNWHKDFSPAHTWGAGIGMPDFERSGCILLWGVDPAVTWLSQAQRIRQAQKRGTRLIVVDPRGAGLAAGADLWLAPRPGTDAALALGLIHLLLADGGHDRAFLSRYSDADTLAPDGSGTVLEKLAERAAGFPPERVETLTGVPSAALKEAARLLAESKPVSFFTWTGTCQQAQATDATRAVNILYALTGDLDAPGGNVWFEKPAVSDIAGFEWVDADTRSQTLGRESRPLGPPSKGWITTRDLFRAIGEGQPYPVRALVSFGGNFLVTKPQTRLAGEALTQLDFFVQAELFHTPTTSWADIVLPAASCWEREGLQAGFAVSQEAESRVQLRPALVSPPGDAKPDTWMVFELAKRLGLADRFFGGDPEAGLAHLLAPIGLTPEALRAQGRGLTLRLATRYRKYETTGFNTPSGKVELWSETLRQAGHDPLPDYRLPEPSPQLPFLLTCGKVAPFCHSQFRNLPSLRKHYPEPVAELAPDVAAARKIRNGDPVAILTAAGEMHALAKVVPRLAAGTVWAQYGWWQDARPVNYNACTEGETFDPVSGSNALRGLACNVRRREG